VDGTLLVKMGCRVMPGDDVAKNFVVDEVDVVSLGLWKIAELIIQVMI
jgi:hypothetical protein